MDCNSLYASAADSHTMLLHDPETLSEDLCFKQAQHPPEPEHLQNMKFVLPP